MEQTDGNRSSFALTARSKGWPSKLYTPIVAMNVEKVIVARGHAMWDTGSEICIISRKLADALQLETAPGLSTRGLTGCAEASLCYAYVAFVAGGGIVTVKCAVVDSHVGGLDYSIIIGMDLIRRGSLAITGDSAGITLSFTMPAVEVVDFTATIHNRPSAVVPLSDGREKLELYTGIEAVKIMRRTVPQD